MVSVRWFVCPFVKVMAKMVTAKLIVMCMGYISFHGGIWGCCSDMYVFIDMLILETLSYWRKLGRTLVVMADCVGWNIRVTNHAFWRMILIG